VSWWQKLVSGSSMQSKELQKYWLLKDKQWVSERQAGWQDILAFIKHYDDNYSKTTLKLYENYYCRGKLTEDEGGQPDVPLVLQLAWHPSVDSEIWLQLYEHYISKVLPQYIAGCTVTEFKFLHDNSPVTLNNAYRSDIRQTLLAGRDRLLYKFFYCTPHIEGLAASATQYQPQIGKGSKFMYEASFYLPREITTNYTWRTINWSSICFEVMPELSLFLTDENYQNMTRVKPYSWSKGQFGDPELVHSALLAGAQLQGRLDSLSPRASELVSLWLAQMEQASPAWVNAWQLAKQEVVEQGSLGAADPWQHNRELTENNAEQVETKVTAPWPENFVALKQAFAEQGYNLPDGTSPHLDEILSTLFPQQRILFGLFTDAAYSADDLTEPFDAFTYPLQRLCELSSSHQLSYQQKGDYLYLKADGNQVGKIYLDDLLDEGSGKDGVANYFKQVVKLAQQWFPGQVYCYGEDEFVLYVLPAEVVALLAQQGFVNKPDYFG